jgi:hypothetical protein
MNTCVDRSGARAIVRSLTPILTALIATGCGNEAPGVESSVAEIEDVAQPITPNSGSTTSPTIEANSTSTTYREVMWVSAGLNCTGTVIGPYAVLSAAHCGAGFSIQWTNAQLDVETSFDNPYLQHSTAPVFTPDWWIALNNAQKAAGGRQDDWPAQHDHNVHFVPALTPTFLHNNNIRPALVGPPGGVGTTNFRIVGVASIPGAGSRAHMAAGFRPTNASNGITVDPRDGYLARNTAPNFGHGDGGDSGGPTFWLDEQPWLNGTTYMARRAIVATLQTTGQGAATSPLAYNPGISMTPNQLLTARLNSLWISARADDADTDGVPYDCDVNPAISDEFDNHFCPPPVGGPNGVDTANVPIGLLECKPGYVPAGLSGRFGDLIDQLSMRCMAYSCFDRPETCGDFYVTDAFGGSGGGALGQACANDSVLFGAHGKASDTHIFSVGSKCAPMSWLRQNSSRARGTDLAGMGNGNGGFAYDVDCAARGAGQRDSWLKGFQARTTDKRFVTGLHPVCDEDRHRAAPYVGGSGGGMTFQKCPVGQVAIGTIQRNQDGLINVFGILCGAQAAVGTGFAVPDHLITLVRTSFAHYQAGFVNSHAVERYSSRHVPSGTTRANCSPGYAMTGVSIKYTDRLTHVTSITCKDIRQGGASTQTVSVNVGGNVGTSASSTCPFGGLVNGLYARSGWLVDGVAMSCVDL